MEVFFKGLGYVIFLGWGLTERVVSWVAWEGEIWLFFKTRRWDFFNFMRNYSFGGVGWGVWRKWVGIILFRLYFFCDMVT
jgi:hypothetical protein